MILVTGSSGLVGRALTARLRSDDIEFQRALRSADLPHGGDLRYLAAAHAALEGSTPSVLVHLAGGPGADRFDVFENNILTTTNLIEATSSAQRKPAVIVLGSAAEYGRGGTRRLSESDPLRPVSDYGIAKTAQTTLALAMGTRLSVSVTILRVFNPVSPELGREVALGNARAQLLEGSGPTRRLSLGRLDVVRDFVPLELVVEAILQVIEDPIPGGVINVCSGVGIRLGDIVAAMADRHGVSITTEVDPRLAALLAPDEVVGDPSRLEQLIGVRSGPTAASLADAMMAS